MSGEKQPPRRLGRGLEALIGGPLPGSVGAPAPQTPPSEFRRIPVASVRPNPFQPRREFDPDELAELQASISANGLLQPITVRSRGDAFELIAGERRLRAVTNLGWHEVPAIVRELDDQALLVLALVENLQRADLNAVEEARGYKRLIDEFGLTQQQVAVAVGKDRTTVTNLLRILTLPEAIGRMVEERQLSSGHARALLPLSDERAMVQLAKEAAANGMSVRELEQRVRDMSRPAGAGPPGRDGRAAAQAPAASAAQDPVIRNIEDELRRYLQTDVQVHLAGPSKGHLKLTFYSADDLERLLELILRENRQSF